MVSIVTDFTCNVIDLRGFNEPHYLRRSQLVAIFLARAINSLIGLCWPCWRFWSSTRWTAEWSVSTARDFETSFWLKVFPRCQESLLALLPALSCTKPLFDSARAHSAQSALLCPGSACIIQTGPWRTSSRALWHQGLLQVETLVQV